MNEHGSLAPVPTCASLGTLRYNVGRERDRKKQDKQDMMPPRIKSTDKCARCRIYRPLCLCGEIVPLILATRVTLYMHWRERLRATNTGWLACLALPNSEIRLRRSPSKNSARPGRRRSRMRFSCFRVRTLWS